MSHVLQVDPPLVALSTDHPIARFAAAELIRYSLAGEGLPLTALGLEPSLAGVELAEGEAYRTGGEPLQLVGASPRDLLHAVYHHLEQRGWRWYFPGPLGEAWLPDTPPPRGGEGPVPERLLVDRCGAKDDPLWRLEIVPIVDWAAKQGFTRLAFECADACPETYGFVVDALARRGLQMEIGGDVVPVLLAEARGGDEQALLHRSGTQRSRRLEVADAETLAALPAVAAAMLERFAPADSLRVCEPSEAPLLTDPPAGVEPVPGARLSAAAARMSDGLGSRRLVVWQPTSAARRGFVVPEEALLVLPAGRRSLAESLGSRADARNQETLQSLLAAAGRPGGVEVSLPYLDVVTLRGLTAPLTRVIAGDVAALAGVGRLAATVHGALTWWAYPLNAYILARCLREPGVSVEALVDDWCVGLYHEVAEPMRRFLARFETAMAPLWQLREPTREPGIQAWRAGEKRGEQVRLAIEAALTELPEVRHDLSDALAAATHPLVQARLEREAAVFDLNYQMVQLRLLRLRAHLGHPSLALHAAARDLVSQLYAQLDQVPLAAAGVALRREYLEQVTELARWCGHDAETPRSPVRAVPSRLTPTLSPSAA